MTRIADGVVLGPDALDRADGVVLGPDALDRADGVALRALGTPVGWRCRCSNRSMPGA